MSVTDEIKTRLDVLDVLGDYISLNKAGRNYKALCPFHQEKTPSFVIFPDKGTWRCFGCGRGGDIFSFVMEHEGMDFSGALRVLAERAGVELTPRTPRQVEQEEIDERLRHLLGTAAEYFHRQLQENDEAAYARQYVESRGLSLETVNDFLIGYAPSGWDNTLSYLLNVGYKQSDLIEAGLVVEKDSGGIYDRFRDRLIIPIHDLKGQVIGFGARALAKDAVPKYLNSPQSRLFDKSSLLYGFAHARRAIRETESAIIVEGYMDVLQAHQAGFTTVVAQMGTALTEPQLRLLSRYAIRIVLALDPDTAGQMATERGLEAIERVSKSLAEEASEQGKWGFDVTEKELRAHRTTEFDPGGMIRYENDLGFDIRVITLPDGHDPDDLIRSDPAAWTALVENALPIVEYMIRASADGKNLDDPKVKTWIVDRVTPLINDIGSSVERAHYRQRLARLLKIPEAALFSKVDTSKTYRPEKLPSSSLEKAAVDRPHILASPTASREEFCLAALIRQPRLIYQINRIFAEALPDASQYLSEEEQAAIDPGVLRYGLAQQVLLDDFLQPEHRAIFDIWSQALDQQDDDPVAYLIEHSEGPPREVVESWLSQPLYGLRRTVKAVENEISVDRINEAVMQALIDLRIKRIEDQCHQLVLLMQDMDNGGDKSVAMLYSHSITLLLAAKRQLSQARFDHSLVGKARSADHPSGPTQAAYR